MEREHNVCQTSEGSLACDFFRVCVCTSTTKTELKRQHISLSKCVCVCENYWCGNDQRFCCCVFSWFPAAAAIEADDDADEVVAFVACVCIVFDKDIDDDDCCCCCKCWCGCMCVMVIERVWELLPPTPDVTIISGEFSSFGSFSKLVAVLADEAKSKVCGGKRWPSTILMPLVTSAMGFSKSGCRLRNSEERRLVDRLSLDANDVDSGELRSTEEAMSKRKWNIKWKNAF